ncbi:hypothetical protein [Lichenicoccus roseus]|uniref:Uncharacterized protein n=1 Tax=Lichenicoccus roseus TaxID=2683649 RepID=A0A5R9J5Z6_9PROT|nr:hypothetical protein [Lichenicoccus roseus]TLU72982.1 hypothetical protein FE263_05900 [Lichenicoccus roseus]
MSAFGRLWRRAPSWRLALFAAVGSTALAAMFPPAMPARLSAAWSGAVAGAASKAQTARLFGVPLLHPHAGAAAGQSGALPHFAPPPDTPAPDYATLAAPPLGPPRHGTIQFAGRQVPLPAGDWIELMVVRDGGPHPLQSTVLGRTGGGQITGLLSLTAPPPIVAPDDGTRPSGACYDPAALASQQSDPGAASAAHECWVMRPLRTSEITEGKGPFIIQRRAIERLQAMDVTVPQSLVELRWFRADASGWMGATLLVRPQADGGSKAEANWMQRWSRLLRRGYDSATPAAVPADPTAG